MNLNFGDSWDAAENLYGPLLRETERQREESENLKRMKETELERKINRCIESFEHEEGRVDYMIVTPETYRELDRLGAINLFKANPFFGEIVGYVPDPKIKVITPDQIKHFGDEKDFERYKENIGLIERGNALVLARRRWCREFAKMGVYRLNSLEENEIK